MDKDDESSFPDIEAYRVQSDSLSPEDVYKLFEEHHLEGKSDSAKVAYYRGRDNCLEFALMHGMHGGMTEEEARETFYKFFLGDMMREYPLVWEAFVEKRIKKMLH